MLAILLGVLRESTIPIMVQVRHSRPALAEKRRDSPDGISRNRTGSENRTSTFFGQLNSSHRLAPAVHTWHDSKFHLPTAVIIGPDVSILPELPSSMNRVYRLVPPNPPPAWP